jgi:hypothetical protein
LCYLAPLRFGRESFKARLVGVSVRISATRVGNRIDSSSAAIQKSRPADDCCECAQPRKSQSGGNPEPNPADIPRKERQTPPRRRCTADSTRASDIPVHIHIAPAAVIACSSSPVEPPLEGPTRVATGRRPSQAQVTKISRIFPSHRFPESERPGRSNGFRRSLPPVGQMGQNGTKLWAMGRLSRSLRRVARRRRYC